MTINQKKKGSRNEREVANLFKAWTGLEFSRVPQSGGLGWHTTNSTGDIICTDEKEAYKFKFTVECKFHQEINFSYLMDGSIGKKTNRVYHFWKQAEEEGKTVNKVPLLFMRRNGMKGGMHFVAMPLDYWMLIGHGEWPLGVMRYCNDEIEIVIVNSEDFFKHDYKTFRKMAKKYVTNRQGK